MLSFLGLRVNQTIGNRQKYKECLQEIKHYLSLKKVDKKVEISENEYLMTVINHPYTFTLVKNPKYLASSYYNMPLFQAEDYQFLEICYECLMIIEEAFPLNVKIEMVTDAESREIMLFQENKREELNRRINNNLRAVVEATTELGQQEVENAIFLVHHCYWRKNKTIALKMLISKVSPNNVAELPSEFLDYIEKLQQEVQLKKLASELSNKIRSIQSQHQKTNENNMRSSNLSQEKYGESVKLQPLIFQLKESYNLERVCALLANVFNSEQDKEYYTKLESSINTVTSKFLSNQFEQASKYGGQFSQLLKQYWTKRGKRWQQTIRTSVQAKVRDASSISRVNSNKSRLLTSRKLNP